MVYLKSQTEMIPGNNFPQVKVKYDIRNLNNLFPIFVTQYFMFSQSPIKTNDFEEHAHRESKLQYSVLSDE